MQPLLFVFFSSEFDTYPHTICKELGYTGAKEWHTRAEKADTKVPHDNKPIALMNPTNCAFTDEKSFNLKECKKDPIYKDCTHRQDIYLVCEGKLQAVLNIGEFIYWKTFIIGIYYNEIMLLQAC